MLYERGVLKNFPTFTDKLKKQSSGGVLSKDVLKNFAKLIEKYLCRNLFFNKVLQARNLKLSEATNGYVQQNKVFLKKQLISRTCVNDASKRI